MWVAELRAWHEDSVVVNATRGLDVTAHTIVLFEEGSGREKWIYRLFTVEGSDSREYLERIRAEPRIEMLEESGSEFTYRIRKKDSFSEQLFDGKVFVVWPATMKDGWNWMTIASPDKEGVLRVFRKAKKLRPGVASKVELVSLKKQRINLFSSSLLLNLTEKQREAVRLAFSGGYYDFPRKSSLEEIAGRKGVPRTSLQHNLRKAEARIFHSILGSRK